MAVSDRVAVMRSGTIAQCDTPQKIYGAPADSFVASFIGGFSLVHGKARGRMFEIADGGAPLRTATELVGEAILVVRPEDARPPGGHPCNLLRGTVTSRAFQGRCWRLYVDIGPDRIRLDWPEGPPVGSTVEFSLPPDCCVVLAK